MSTNEIAGDHVPTLTINHENVAELDSTNAFEGPEKLLEVWFAASPAAIPESASGHPDGKLGLKAVTKETWEVALDLVHCKILSVIESDEVDAYLLSESSMFVFAHKIILKTCGTTTLLLGLKEVLSAAAGVGFPGAIDTKVSNRLEASPYRVFYSRKNFLFPDRQVGPHRSWKDEVGMLDTTFNRGSAYLIGKMNGDHWYLWLMEPRMEEYKKMTDTKHIGYSGDDETLEVLMTDLDEKNARQFYLADSIAAAEKKFLKATTVGRLSESSTESTAGTSVDGSADEGIPTPDTLPEELTTEGHALGTVVSEGCGLSSVYPTDKYPDAVVDAYMFNPCGFSANGVIPAPVSPNDTGDVKNERTHYFNVHVTPEPVCSYASFETNVPTKQSGRQTKEIVEHVLEIFKPGRFQVTLFEARAADSTADVFASSKAKMDNVEGFRCTDRIVHSFDGYDLVFAYYEANDWVDKKGAVKMGEEL